MRPLHKLFALLCLLFLTSCGYKANPLPPQTTIKTIQVIKTSKVASIGSSDKYTEKQNVTRDSWIVDTRKERLLRRKPPRNDIFLSLRGAKWQSSLIFNLLSLRGFSFPVTARNEVTWQSLFYFIQHSKFNIIKKTFCLNVLFPWLWPMSYSMHNPQQQKGTSSAYVRTLPS